MKKSNVFKRIVSAVCSVGILMSGLSIPVMATEINGGEAYGWTGVGLAKQPSVPFSMNFDKPYEGSLGIASENTTVSDVVKITNSSGNVAYASPLDYTLKGENDGVVKMTYTNVDGTDPKNKNEIWIFNNASELKTAHSIEFDLYLDGDYSAIGFQERNVFTGWSNNSLGCFKKGWQKVAIALTDTEYRIFVDGVLAQSASRRFDAGKSAFLRMWVSVEEQGKSATVAIDNLTVKEGAYYTNAAIIDSTSEEFTFDDNSTSVILHNEGNVTSKIVNGKNNFAAIDYTLKGIDDGVARVDFTSSADADLRGTVRLTDSTITEDFTLEFELYADGGANSVGVLGKNIVGYDASWLKTFNNYIVRNQWNEVALSFLGNNAYLYINGTKVSETANNARTADGWLRLGVQFTGTQEGQTRTATIAIDNLKAYEGAYTGELYAKQAVITSTADSFDFNNEVTSVMLFDNGNVTSKVVKNGNNFAAIDYTLKGNNDGVARVDFTHSGAAAADLRGTVRLVDNPLRFDDFTIEFELYADKSADEVGLIGKNIVGYDAPWVNALNTWLVRGEWNDVALRFSGDSAYLYVNGAEVSKTYNNGDRLTAADGWLRLGVKFAQAESDAERTATIAIDNLKAYEGAYTGEIIPDVEMSELDGGVTLNEDGTFNKGFIVENIILSKYKYFAISFGDVWKGCAVEDFGTVVSGDSGVNLGIRINNIDEKYENSTISAKFTNSGSLAQ